MTPLETLQLWFTAFEEQDLETARTLWSANASLHAPGGTFCGDFDEFLNWYAHRRDSEGDGFAWQVQDLLGGDHYAAAVIRLVSDTRPGGWDQHAVYEIEGGTIKRVWLHESSEAD